MFLMTVEIRYFSWKSHPWFLTNMLMLMFLSLRASAVGVERRKSRQYTACVKKKPISPKKDVRKPPEVRRNDKNGLPSILLDRYLRSTALETILFLNIFGVYVNLPVQVPLYLRGTLHYPIEPRLSRVHCLHLCVILNPKKPEKACR